MLVQEQRDAMHRTYIPYESSFFLHYHENDVHARLLIIITLRIMLVVPKGFPENPSWMTWHPFFSLKNFISLSHVSYMSPTFFNVWSGPFIFIYGPEQSTNNKLWLYFLKNQNNNIKKKWVASHHRWWPATPVESKGWLRPPLGPWEWFCHSLGLKKI